MQECCPVTLNRNRKILWTVMLLNLSLFAVEIWQGVLASSTSLLADSMDFLGDAISYGVTLCVLTSTLRIRAKSALLKAALMLLMAVIALTQGAYNVITGEMPEYVTMGWVGTLALIVNLTCAMLLYRSRGQDSNMRSIWLCSRNDIINNIAILIAAYGVYITGTLWPDLIVAVMIAGLGTVTALQIITDATKELRQ